MVMFQETQTDAELKQETEHIDFWLMCRIRQSYISIIRYLKYVGVFLQFLGGTWRIHLIKDVI